MISITLMNCSKKLAFQIRIQEHFCFKLSSVTCFRYAVRIQKTASSCKTVKVRTFTQAEILLSKFFVCCIVSRYHADGETKILKITEYTSCSLKHFETIKIKSKTAVNDENNLAQLYARCVSGFHFLWFSHAVCGILNAVSSKVRYLS